MAFINWSASLAVNVTVIDNQHKQLISLINALFDAMTAGKGKDILGQTLSNLIEYTKMHFSTEERLMKEFNYPLAAKHILEHSILTKQVIELNNEFQAGKALLSAKVLDFLKEWLSNHIMQNDKKFGEFLNKAGKK